MEEITLKASFTAGGSVSKSLVGKQQLEGDKLSSPGEGSRSLLILLNLGAWRPKAVATKKFMQELLKSDYVHQCAVDIINVKLK